MGRKDFKRRCGEFVAEYRALCEKHRMSLGACGCCDSPWVADLDGRYQKTGAEVLDKEIAHLLAVSCAPSSDDD